MTYMSPNILTKILKIKYYFEEYSNLKKDNDELKKKLAYIALKNITYQDLIRENERLKKLLGYRESSSFFLIPAGIISRNQDYINLSLVISKGYRDGIYRNAVVIGIGGIVGKLSKVMADYSIVQTYYDLNSRISAIDIKSGTVGIISWDGRSRNLIFKISSDADIREGNRIITTGIGGIYPRGIDIGVIAPGPYDRSTLLLNIPVIPTQELAILDNVFVITNEKQDSVMNEPSSFKGEIIFEIGDWRLKFFVE